jgi:methionyl-tRNA synthetase
MEAVIGYLSASIEWAQKNGDSSKWEYFWKDPDCKHYYFMREVMFLFIQ